MAPVRVLREVYLMRYLSRFFLPLLAVFALAVAGCSKPGLRCASPEDNPLHHYSVGMGLLERGDISGAFEKFDRGLWCDKKFAPGYAGAAIAGALGAAALEPGKARDNLADRAFNDLKKSYRRSETTEDEFASHIAEMRVNTALKPNGWLKESESAYRKSMKLKVDERALPYYEGREAAPYFMGLAYLEAREFQPARDRFADALGYRREGKWNEKADLAWKRTDKLVRALSGITLGDIGKEIAVKGSVSRGDMAALLVDELKIDKLFAGRIPVKSEVDKQKPASVPTDVEQSPFKHEILALMKWSIRGLEPSSGLFNPEKPVTRKDFAFVLEDVLIKLTGDESMSSAYFGHQRSPFPDVQASSAWYNAIMNVTTRNVMETELSGEFRPDEDVDGAEAILAIRVLKQRLNIY